MAFRGRAITKSNGFHHQNQLQKRFCGFCKRNGETPEVYEQHITKDELGKVVCPHLRKHVCELCGATGDEAHTSSHCKLAEMGRNDPFFSQLFHSSGGKMTNFYNMVALKRTRVNSAGKTRRYWD